MAAVGFGFDGMPCISYEGYFDTEEWLEYMKRLEESKGFDVPGLPPCPGPLFGVIQPANLRNGRFNYKWATMLAIQHLDKKDSKNANFELKKIVKINLQGSGPIIFYITFEAAAKDGVIKTYQAKVVQTFPKSDSYVNFVRVKPGSSSSSN